MREDIEFDADGVTLRGWFYRPDDATARRRASSWPTGSRRSRRCTSTTTPRSSATRPGLRRLRQPRVRRLRRGARASRARRSTPGSRSATTSTRSPTPRCVPRSTPSRIGVWGSSYSGAHPTSSGRSTGASRRSAARSRSSPGVQAFDMLVRLDNWAATWELLAADRIARASGEAPAMMPVVDADPTAPSALPTPDSYEFFTRVRGLVVEERGDAADDRDVPGLRAGRVPQADLPDAAAHGRRAERPPRRGRDRAARRTRRRRTRRSSSSCRAGTSTPTSATGFEISSGAARDWFVEHLITGAAVRRRPRPPDRRRTDATSGLGQKMRAQRARSGPGACLRRPRDELGRGADPRAGPPPLRPVRVAGYRGGVPARVAAPRRARRARGRDARGAQARFVLGIGDQSTAMLDDARFTALG